MKIVLVTGLLLAVQLLSGTALAEPAPDSVSGREKVERSEPPAIAEHIPDAAFPRITERRLDNGIPVYIAVRPKVPLETVYFVFPEAGVKNDPLGKYGLTQITAECLELGGGSRDTLAFAEARDLAGSRIRAFAYCDYLSVMVSGISEKLPDTLDLAADAIISPAFAQPELKN